MQEKTSIASKSGKLGDFIGGIAVVVTLICLANQIRQNTSALCTASRVTIYTGYRAQKTHLFDTNVSEAYAAGLRHYLNMPSSQKRVFSHTINDHALFMHGAFILYEVGTLLKKDYSAYLNRFSSNVVTPGDQYGG